MLNSQENIIFVLNVDWVFKVDRDPRQPFLVFLEAKNFFVATLFMVPPLPKYFFEGGKSKKKFGVFFSFWCPNL